MRPNLAYVHIFVNPQLVFNRCTPINPSLQAGAYAVVWYGSSSGSAWFRIFSASSSGSGSAINLPNRDAVPELVSMGFFVYFLTFFPNLSLIIKKKLLFLLNIFAFPYL